MKHGDFTGLAENYSLYRPGYSGFVVDFICDVVKGKFEQFIDYIKERTNGETNINAHYQTRAWVAQKKKS